MSYKNPITSNPQRFTPVRINDFSWGINLRVSADLIDDNQFQEIYNMSPEGNKLILIKGYTIAKTLAGSWRINWIKLFSNYLFVLTQWNLVAYNLNTWNTYTQTSVYSNLSDRYQIVVDKRVDISIIIVNANTDTTEDIKAYEYDTTGNTFTSKTFVGLSDKNFKCAAIYQWKLMLGGNPKSPSILYYSKTSDALAMTNLYDFSGYNSWSQPVDDGEAIVAFASNNTEFFVVKKNWFHKITSDKDTLSAYGYVLNKETQSWVINPFSILNVNKEIIYFDGVTVRRLSYEQNIQALSDSAIGEPIEKIFENLSQSQANNAFMVYAYPYVKLYLRSNLSTENDFCVLYNTVDKAFSIQTAIEWNVGDYWMYGNKNVSYVGSRFEPTIYKDNEWTSFNEGDVVAYAKSKKLTMGDGVAYKLFRLIEFKWNVTIWLPVTFSIYWDGKLITTKTISSTSITTIASTMGSSTFGSTLIGSSWGSWDNTTTFELKIPLYNTVRQLEYTIDIEGQWIFELTSGKIEYRIKNEYWTH